MTAKSIYGSAIAVMLLALYAGLVVAALWVPSVFTSEMASATALVGGLVSALVIAQLGASEPGKLPAAQALVPDPSDTAVLILKVVTTAYVAVWAACGLAALILGWLNPDVNVTIAALGKSWLGLAIASGYAYFGLKP